MKYGRDILEFLGALGLAIVIIVFILAVIDYICFTENREVQYKNYEENKVVSEQVDIHS